MTELDKKLLEIAQKDWANFVKLVGEDAIISAKACIMRQKGSTYGQISGTLKKPRQTIVSYLIIKNCNC